MKKIFTTSRLMLVVGTIYLIGCTSNTEKIKALTQEIDSIKSASPAYWEAYYDTAGVSTIYAMAPPKKPYDLKHPWAKNKRYVLCVNTVLNNGDKGVIVTLSNPGIANSMKSIFLELRLNKSGVTQVSHLSKNNKFSPQISIQVVDKDGNLVDYEIMDSTADVSLTCSPGFAVKEKVSSRATQSSTVQVTIDER